MFAGRWIASVVVSLFIISVLAFQAVAGTIYVHPTEGSYHTIADGINAAVVGDTVLVAAGTYGSFTVNKRVNIVSEAGPETTRIISNSRVTFNDGAADSSFAGFAISITGAAGIYVASACSQLVIKNNIISGCGSHGIHLFADYRTNLSNVTIINNTISFNSGSGIYFQANEQYGNYGELLNCSVINNVCTNNTSYGLHNSVSSPFVQTTLVANNDVWGNTAGPSLNFVGVDTTHGNLFVEPLFIDAEKGDYHLQSASLCIDAGKVGIAYNDPDGTRNNMGVYGGPGAAGFWPEPAGGPVVTILSVTPPSVPVGGTLSLQATGEIR